MNSTASVIPISIQRMICTGCGAEANASCNCGVAYQPKAVRAAEAIQANPEKSDRTIAKEIGASPTTVGKAREELSTTGQLKDSPRIGLDGKTRSPPKEVFEDPIKLEEESRCETMYRSAEDAYRHIRTWANKDFVAAVQTRLADEKFRQQFIARIRADPVEIDDLVIGAQLLTGLLRKLNIPKRAS